MKAAYEFTVKPLSLNEMLSSRWVKDKFKREIYAQLSEYLEYDSRTIETVVNTKSGKKKFVFRRYEQPLFDIVNIKWEVHFRKKRKRDRRNIDAGLKWIEDCLVEANVLTDDSIEYYAREKVKIFCGVTDKIKVIINDAKRKS